MGDTCSWIPILSQEANTECANYVKSISNYVLPSGNLALAADDLCLLTLHNMTMDPPELRNK